MRPGQILESIRSSLWFLPACIVIGAIGLALGLVELENGGSGLAERWPRLFGAGASGARDLLSSIASSTITIAGVVFSITVVVLSLASSQYTSRVLRNFMRDRVNQATLGTFVGIFTYCLVVLRTVRDPGEDGAQFVPSLAVFGGLVLGILGIALLVFFIHYIARSIQATEIIAAVGNETRETIDRLFPDEVDSEDASGDDMACAPGTPVREGERVPVLASRTGYVQGLDIEELVELAQRDDAIVQSLVPVGGFVVDGTPIAVVTSASDLDPETVRRFGKHVSIGRQRTTQQDAAFGMRQLVDVALKTLSPSVNETTTATLCLDQLAATLVLLSGRRLRCSFRDEDGQVRLGTPGPDYAGFVELAFDEIRRSAEGNVAALESLLRAIERVAAETSLPARRQALAEQVRAATESIGRSVPAPAERDRLAERVTEVLRLCERNPAGRPG